MIDTFDKHDLNDFIGKHLVYTYDSGWDCEIYAKNSHALDYRIHSGIVDNRWVKDQEAYIVWVGKGIYKISWAESTGTDVSLIASLSDELLHDIIFLPRRIINNPEKTIRFQNNHIPLMNSYRSAGPTYPAEVIDELATITFIRDCGADNDEVINCPASELPVDLPASL